jgi:hypothetical protein
MDDQSMMLWSVGIGAVVLSTIFFLGRSKDTARTARTPRDDESAYPSNDIRDRRLQRLDSRDDSTEWASAYFKDGIANALKKHAAGAKLIISIENSDNKDTVSIRLRRYCWSDKRVIAAIQEEKIILIRLVMPSEEAKFVCKVFGKEPKHAPFLMFMANGMARIVQRPAFTAESFIKFVKHVQDVSSKEAEEKGTEVAQAAQRKQASGLLDAHTHFQMGQLVRKGVLRPGDFVVEDENQAEQDAASAAEQEEQWQMSEAVRLVEEAERTAMRDKQEREYEAGLQADKRRSLERTQEKKEREEADQKRATALEDAELAQEAKEVWKAMQLQEVPAEPEPKSPGAIRLCVVMKGSGRRLTRYFRNTDQMGSLFHFVGGSCTEDEEVESGHFTLVSSYPQHEYESTTQTLEEAGLGSTVLHVKEKED